MQPTRDPKHGGKQSRLGGVEKRGLEINALTSESGRKKRLRRDTSTASLPGAAAAAEVSPPLNEHPQVEQPETGIHALISLPNPLDIDQQVQTAIQAMQNASPIGGQAHLQAIKTLRQYLSNYENPPTLAVLSSGGIPALISALQPPQSNETSVETIFEAAWALTNLAVGEPAVVKAVVPAAPILIAHLGGGSGLAVAEQCAWALGNIAGDDVEYKETLISNGAVPPLAQLMILGVQSAMAAKTASNSTAGAAMDNDIRSLLEIRQTIETGATASWALANLLRGAGETEIAAFMSNNGAASALVMSLTINDNDNSGHPLPDFIDSLCIETAWVLAYVTAGPEKFLLKLVEDPCLLITPLMMKLNTAVERMLNINTRASSVPSDSRLPTENASASAAARVLVTPLLRTLGNVLAAVGGVGGSGNVGKESSAIFLSQLIPNERTESQESFVASETIKSVVICAESAEHGLQREAAWVLANYAGTSGRAGVDAIKKAGAVPALMSLLKHQPFHVRKEAAFALANICAGGGGGTGDAEALNYLFGADLDALRAMLSLVRSADVEAARLGLQFVEMLLRMLPVNGAREVEAADGIDALECLQFGATAPPELQAAAASLVNTYWGVEVE
ncbi:hypothetical protein Ndes2526B_g00143 [Nannochloris sp. 'desiccata']|nr:putative Importin subunit alpha-9 [Chlorella desiccata (nom. nud.)]